MNCSQMITFLHSLLFCWFGFFLLFVNGNKQVSLLFICRPFLHGFAGIPEFNENICLAGCFLLLTSIWGNRGRAAALH